jgi:hypothetical protein
MRPLARPLKIACIGAVVAAILNFVTFWCVGVALGGDALNGKREGERYFLANHGKLTEVREPVWRYSRAHAISVTITHPLGLACFALLIASRQRTGKLPHSQPLQRTGPAQWFP